MKDYDVVVVGAGLGGLSASAFLARAGKKVLLLEKHNVPGGYASTFTRGRFEFEISLHALSGLGGEMDRGPLKRIFRALDILDRVEFVYLEDIYRSVFPDVDVTVPVGREAYEETLCREFPADAEGIRRFTGIMFDYVEQALRANRVGMKEVMKDPSAYPTLMKYFGKTLSEVLNEEVIDERARGVISQLWGYYCHPPSKVSFTIYAMGTASYIRFGPAHIRGKSQALSQAFVDSIEGSGGDVRLNNGAAKILTSRGKVRGVVAEDGTEILCPYVVCNANPFTVCIDLIGLDEIPGWYSRRMGAGSPGASTINVYLGLDCPYTDLGITSQETFINTDYDIDRHSETLKQGTGMESMGAVMTTYNVSDPEFSPPGTTNMVLTGVLYAEPWLKLSPERYLETKNAVASRLLDLAESVAPGIRDHIEVVEAATPLTNARFAGTPGGSIIGFDEKYRGTGLDSLPSRGPLDGLYFSSAYVNIGGGYEPTIASGYMASRDVLHDMDKGGREASTMEKVRSKVERQAGDAAPLTGEATRPMREALERMHPRRVSLEVSEIIDETDSTKTLRMVAREGDLPYFRAGQYVNLFVEIDGVLTSRPYSIASAPGKPYWDMAVRRMPGGFVSHYLLDRVRVGDTFESTGPGGSFYHEPLMDTNDLVFLAGGSGVTPFMSIIRQAAGTKPPLRVHLIYGSRDPSDIIFAEELEKLAAGHPGLRIDFVISEPPEGWTGLCGLLDREVLAGLVGDVDGKTFYVCGPSPMYGLCESALETMGVPRRRIRREVYGPPVDVRDDPGWPGVPPDTEFEVVEDRSGKRIKARAGEPLMNSLERGGIVINAVCRAGECTFCRTRLLEGKVYAPERVRRRWVDEKAGYIHPCMSYPLGDLRIRV